MPSLAHTLVSAPGHSPDRWVLFLHGIFGSGANWRSFARNVTTARPRWGAALVDLRMHGGSQALPPPHTVAAAARDLRELEPVLPGPVEAVVGHSFGGKVALGYVRERGGDLAQAWILDAMPGPRPDARGSELTVRVLELLGSLPALVPSREAFVAHFERAGITSDLAQWLAMNLRRDGEGYALRLDLAAVRALLDDYLAQDLWPVIESPPGRVGLDLVVGGRSAVFSAQDRERVERAAARAPERVRVHVFPDAGHWVHVDAPDALLDVVLDALPTE